MCAPYNYILNQLIASKDAQVAQVYTPTNFILYARFYISK